ncbi:SusC/RagA family TonB-linked outer membrane protein [Sphingobacterium sp. DR205]|uniref:SusC/RagA family TonB-linked outer membrane protein n=1 Tax=Sphingobacterium sp. DR205 TaxID=2713573 RepID=UPI0013E43852|nr:SusC/RagA family TonB-linked outer membrane protein [Sphingobacterium sp. DR205]QIH35708.1 SusC/RagA family TonB-linked outer membrane protein [Sphingobacterium sp. DR205]
MKQKLLKIFLVYTLLIGVVYAQNRQVRGKVTSASDGTAIQGASVFVQGSSLATQTDGSGNYSINAASGATLVFSYVGYQRLSVTIGNRTTIDVQLTSDKTSLEEVIVTGYGSVKKSDFAGSVAQIANKEIENRPVANVTQNLQGRVPGLLANSGSGQPGARANVIIRGIKSIQGSGTQPLYVVDGIPVSDNSIANLNANDFESVTVLKDASAAALYGARGGTGVIVITTKQGKKGSSEITLRTQMGVTRPPDFKRLNLMNTAELLAFEERSGVITQTSNAGFSNVPGWYYSPLNPANANLSAAQKAEYARKLDSTRNINTDIGDLFFRNGLSQNYELNLRGGSDNVRYFSSVGYYSQDGIDKTSNFKRYSGRFNLDYTKGRFNAQWNSNMTYSTSRKAIGDSWGNSPLNPFQMIYRGKPYDNPYLADGTLNFGAGSTNLNPKSLANVIETQENSRWNENKWKINTGLNLSLKITDDLTLRNVLGIDADNNLYEYYINPDSYRGSVQTHLSGFVREATLINAQIINTTSLSYNKTFNEKHNVSVAGYFEGLRTYNKGSGFLLYNLNKSLPWTGQGANPLPTNGAATMPQNARSAKSGYGIRSFFANASYGYVDRYVFNANIRRDGTSRILNDKNKEITTWSASAVWNAHNEAFLKDHSIINNLRLRGSYGVTPNIGSILVNTYDVYGFDVPNYLSAQLPGFGTTSYVGSPLSGLYPTTPGNPNLKIENISKANLGFDLSLLNSRINLSMDFYKETTNDLFVNQPLSNTTGFNSMAINAGKMSNKGLEVALSGDVVKTPDYKLTLGWQHAININKIEDLGSVSEYESGTFIIRKGLPYGSHYTYHYLGADPETGRPTYYAQDGVTKVYSQSQAGRFATFGTYLPKHVGGFNIDARYKRFSVSTLFSYQFDVVRSDNARNWITDGSLGYTASVRQTRELIDNQWLKPGDEKFFPSPAYSRGFTNADLQNAKFLRFRELNVAYDLPGFNVAGKSVLKGGSVYFTAYNLAIWSPWKGQDPEDNNNISANEYPNPRMFVFGVDFKF